MMLKCTGPSELIFIHSPHQTLAKDNPHVHIKLDIHVNKYLLPETWPMILKPFKTGHHSPAQPVVLSG